MHEEIREGDDDLRIDRNGRARFSEDGADTRDDHREHERHDDDEDADDEGRIDEGVLRLAHDFVGTVEIVGKVAEGIRELSGLLS